MRTLLPLFLLMSLPALLVAQLCEPDTSYTQPGIHPSDTALPIATVNTYYEHVLTIVVPEKQDTNGITILVDSIELFATIGMPPWLSLQCVDTCIFRSADTGCAVLQGTPPGSLADTTYQMGFITKAYLRFQFAPNNPFVQFDTVAHFWTLKVQGSTGIKAAKDQGMKMYIGAHNTLFVEGAMPYAGPYTLEVYNLLGQRVYRSRFDGHPISQQVDLSGMWPGIHLVTLSGAGGRIAEKIVVR
jgi:hypothetical protein